MAVVYYPKSSKMAQRDTLSASYEQIILSSEPNTVLYFDSGSGLNAFSSSLIYLTASNALTTSYILTADNANSASYSFYAKTASYATYAETSSYEATIEISSSWASASISASHADLADSASYYPAFPAFPTAVPSASWVSSSAHITNADTASYVASASYYPPFPIFPTAVPSASWVSASAFITTAQTASYVSNLYPQTVQVSASWASQSLSASYVPNLYPQTVQVSASWASQSLSASWVPDLYPQTVQVSASWASQSLSSSYVPDLYPQTVQVSCSWASQSLSSSYASNVPLTASYALEALSASWAPDIESYPASASWASSSVSASYASTVPQDLLFNSLTASYISASVKMEAPSPTDYDDVATKGYVDNIVAQNFDLYFRTASADVAGYEKMLRLDTPLSASVNELIVNNVSASQYAFSFISDVLGVSSIQQGSLNIHFHLYRAGGNAANTVQPELYIRSGSTERFEFPSATAQVITTTAADSFVVPLILTSSVTLDPLVDRLVCKFKCINGTNTPNLHMTVEGQTGAGVSIPIPSSNFVLKSGDTMTGNLTVPQVIGTASYATTICPQSAYQWTGSFYNDYGTSVTIASTDNGKVIEMTGSSTQTITLATASIDLGWSATYYQSGIGKITFAAAGGSTLRSRTTFTSTAGQYALVTLMRVGNGDFVLAGDVGA